MALVWDSARNTLVDDGGARMPRDRIWPPHDHQERAQSQPALVTSGDETADRYGRGALALSDAIGGAALDAYGLHPVAELIHDIWKRVGLL